MSQFSLKGLAQSRLLTAAFNSRNAPSLQEIEAELSSKTVVGKETAAVVVNLSGSTFKNNLEKHIDDYNKGKGNLSKATGGRVQQLHLQTGSDLNTLHPRAAKAYAGYTSSLDYGANSRFKAGVYDVTRDTQKIQNAYAKEDQYREYYESLFNLKDNK